MYNRRVVDLLLEERRPDNIWHTICFKKSHSNRGARTTPLREGRNANPDARVIVQIWAQSNSANLGARIMRIV